MAIHNAEDALAFFKTIAGNGIIYQVAVCDTLDAAREFCSAYDPTESLYLIRPNTYAPTDPMSVAYPPMSTCTLVIWGDTSHQIPVDHVLYVGKPDCMTMGTMYSLGVYPSPKSAEDACRELS
jgi:hypothetical protein